MNKRTSLILLATLILSACASTPTRQPEAQKPAPILESGSTPTESGGYLPGDGPTTSRPISTLSRMRYRAPSRCIPMPTAPTLRWAAPMCR